MTSLVEELQRDSLDSNCSISDLLRKAKVVASKLGLEEFLIWTKHELDGYDIDPPSYREVTGRVRVWNPYRGWLPLQFPDPGMERKFSTRLISQKVAELEQLAKMKSGELHVPFPPEIAQMIRNSMNYPLEPTLAIASTAVNGILDAVRNIILDWSLKLEKNEIKGEGMTFSKEDKAKAQAPGVVYQIDRIENFSGNMGGVSGHGVVNATTTIGIDADALTGLVKQLDQNRKQFGLTSGKQVELEKTLSGLTMALDSAIPKPSKVGALLGTARAIIQSAGSSLLVQGALFEIDKFKHLIHM